MHELTERFVRALTALSSRFVLTMGWEKDPDDGHSFWSACILEQPPEGGWSTRGAYFNHPPEALSHQTPCPEVWRHEDVARVGVSSNIPDLELVVTMIEHFVA